MKRSFSLIIVSVILVISMLVVSIGAVSEEDSIGSTPYDTADQSGNAAVVDSREEVIYALLGADGSTESVYAVNILNVLQSGTVHDKGSYSKVKNLTNTEEIIVENEGVTFKAESGRFYYQGEMSAAELPWDIEINYKLDGVEIEPENLAGSSGHLEITILVSQNMNVDSSYFENCMLQISVTLSSEKANGISAPDATVANSGSDKLLTYTVFPGTQGDISISADVNDFEMEGISFSALPYSMSVDLNSMPEVTEALSSLTDAVAQLNEGAGELSAGAEELNVSAAQLRSGSYSLKMGLDSINSQSEAIVNASEKIKEALDYISLNLEKSEDLSVLSDMAGSLAELTEGLDCIGEKMKQLSDGFNTAWKTLEQAILSIPEGNISENELQQLYMANPESDVLSQLIENYQAAQAVRVVYQNVKDVFEMVGENLPVFADATENMSDEIAQAMKGIAVTDDEHIETSLLDLADGISGVSDNYAEFHSGLIKFVSGIDSVATAYTELDEGIYAFSEGTDMVSEGAGQLSEGLGVMNSETSAIPDKIEKMTSESENNYMPVSFTDAENGELVSIQFILRSEPIAKVENKDEAVITDKEESVWDRFLALFD